MYNVTSEKRISYTYFYSKEVKDFKVWSHENRINGLYFNNNQISFSETKEKLNEINSEYNILSGEHEQRDDSVQLPLNAFFFSRKNIIEGSVSLPSDLFGEEDYEIVDFIDGKSELLNLKKMQKDFFPRLQTSLEDSVSFTLQEKPYPEDNLSETFKVFNGEQELDVANVVVVDLVCTVTFTEFQGVTKDFHAEYFYINEEDTKNKVSINYEDGILYTSKVIQDQNKYIEYSTGSLSVEYYLRHDIENFSYDKEDQVVEVFTEEFLEINNQVKLGFLENKEDSSIKDLEEYYSPIIYSVEVNFEWICH